MRSAIISLARYLALQGERANSMRAMGCAFALLPCAGQGKINEFVKRAPVAQMDRACASEAQGRGFEPLRARHFLRSLFSTTSNDALLFVSTLNPRVISMEAIMLSLVRKAR